MFAQLSVRGVYQGPHVFVVRLRDDEGRPARGVRIQDNGPKVRAPLTLLLCAPLSGGHSAPADAADSRERSAHVCVSVLCWMPGIQGSASACRRA